MTAQFQYTTGVGVGGGTLLDGLKGSLLKGWTVTSQLNAGSGLPLTPVYLTSVPGTGVTGTIRPDATGAIDPVSSELLSESGGVRRAGAGPLGERGPELDHRPRPVRAERGHHAHVHLGRAAQPGLADRRDQRAQSRHLLRREHDVRQSAVRAAESREYDAEGADESAVEVLI